MLRWPLLAGALLALLAVMAGAFGAHGLRALVSERLLEVYGTATTYQMYHSLALLAVALLSGLGLSRRLLGWAGACFVAGILLFSGSLYGLVLAELALLDLGWLGPVTPVGGVFFMVGWGLLMASAAHPGGSNADPR